MADFKAVGEQFTEFYYQTFDTNRAGLEGLYRENSCLTFETDQLVGAKAISEKLTNLAFQKVRHDVATKDAQPGPQGCIIMMITGKLLIEETSTMAFSQTFYLVPEGGSYYVLHDIFRLVYP